MTTASTPTCAAAISLIVATHLLPAQTVQQPLPAPAATSPGATAPHLSSNRNNNLFLDAAHGGADDGARIGDRVLEKDLTLALAGRIRAQLGSQENLNLVLTREPSSGDPALDTQPPAPTIDSRAGIANHAHAFACVLLHATAAGSGVHIVSSELPPPDPAAPVTPGTAWATAQAAWVGQSLRLANQVGISLLQAGIPVYLTHASVRPLDSLTCPAIAIEVAPPHAAPSDPSRIEDANYQQRISTAIASGLIAWRNRATPAQTVAPAPATSPKPAAPSAAPQTAVPVRPVSPEPARPTSPRTTPPESSIPRPAPSTEVPAPIIRRPPPPAAPPEQQAAPTSPPPAGARP